MERPEAYMGDQPYLFVSYSHKDSERVWPVILKLQSEGFRVWYDDGITPGTEWDTNIATHIRNCAFFIAFITGNYLQSDNCKDELSFVRELSKNRVLIYLEEVTLPDEMQMRLGRLQAIYWNRNGEKKALRKLLLSPGINTCKEPTISDNSLPVKTVDSSSELNALPQESKKVASAEKDTLVKKTAPNHKFILIAGIGAVLLLIAIFILIPKESSPTDESAASIQEESNSGEEVIEENPEKDFLTKAWSVYSNGIVSNKEGSLFAGILFANTTTSKTFKEQQDLDYNGDIYSVSSLPFMTISSFDDQNSIILGFYDKFGSDFYFYGTYSVDGETLAISPGGSAGSFSQDCAPLTENLTYSIIIADSNLRLSSGDTYVNLNGLPNQEGDLILKGALSDGSESYDGIQSMDLVYDLENENLKKCVLTLEDGKTANIDSCRHFANIHSFILEWSSVDYIMNGKTVTDDVKGYLNFRYINQDPAGFIILSKNPTDTLYYYQDLSEF